MLFPYFSFFFCRVAARESGKNEEKLHLVLLLHPPYSLLLCGCLSLSGASLGSRKVALTSFPLLHLIRELFRKKKPCNFTFSNWEKSHLLVVVVPPYIASVQVASISQRFAILYRPLCVLRKSLEKTKKPLPINQTSLSHICLPLSIRRKSWKVNSPMPNSILAHSQRRAKQASKRQLSIRNETARIAQAQRRKREQENEHSLGRKNRVTQAMYQKEQHMGK